MHEYKYIYHVIRPNKDHLRWCFPSCRVRWASPTGRGVEGMEMATGCRGGVRRRPTRQSPQWRRWPPPPPPPPPPRRTSRGRPWRRCGSPSAPRWRGSAREFPRLPPSTAAPWRRCSPLLRPPWRAARRRRWSKPATTSLPSPLSRLPLARMPPPTRGCGSKWSPGGGSGTHRRARRPAPVAARRRRGVAPAAAAAAVAAGARCAGSGGGRPSRRHP